jgi:catechol 2,3-dioxygenase-like lactoylglutathione lyase family enzyme
VLGHISLGVTDLGRATVFYDATMAALGFARVFSGAHAVGYGVRGSSNDKLLLILKPAGTHPPGEGFHLAFDAPTREAVDRFHVAALGCGGRDNGAPGLRPHYGPEYYAAFVVDPEGYNLEAVCQ